MAERLRPPVSKSDAHRALVLAELCDGAHEAWLPAERPRDVEVLTRGLIALRSPNAVIDCLDAGAPFRFLLTQAALNPNATTQFTGTDRLRERPQQALMTALETSLGVTVRFTGEGWPLVVRTQTPNVPRRFSIAGAESSQFASSLLLGAARLVKQRSGPVAVEVEGEATSTGYRSLTVDWLRRFGFVVEEAGSRIDVTSWTKTNVPPVLPGDWSSLTYLLPLAWHAGLAVEGVDRSAAHPDRAFAEHLVSSGLRFEHDDSRVMGTLSRSFDVDVSKCPDAVPALVAVALVAPSPSRFTRAGVLRLKESDRLAGVIDLARTLGATTQLEGETLTVFPATNPTGGVFDGRDDHRLVMAAAVASRLLGVELAIRGTAAVSKSFPSFWNEAAKANVTRRDA